MKEKRNWWRSLYGQTFAQSCAVNWTGLFSEVLNAQIQYLKYEGSSYSAHEHQSPVRSTSRNAPTKPPDRLYRQTQSTAAGFADRRPCWSVLIIETRKECDKEKLRRDKNETAKVRLLLYCQGTKTRESEKTLWGIIAKSLDKVINMSD